MKEKQTTPGSTETETTPDELMEEFQGKSLKTIVVFTVIIHAVLILGTSIPFILENFVGEDTSEVSEEERKKLALEKAKESLRAIADEHGLKMKDLSSQFAGGAKPEKKPAKPAKQPPTPEEPDKPKSSIEKEIDVKAKGPDVPPVGDDDEDLFK